MRQRVWVNFKIYCICITGGKARLHLLRHFFEVRGDYEGSTERSTEGGGEYEAVKGDYEGCKGVRGQYKRVRREYERITREYKVWTPLVLHLDSIALLWQRKYERSTHSWSLTPPWSRVGTGPELSDRSGPACDRLVQKMFQTGKNWPVFPGHLPLVKESGSKKHSPSYFWQGFR